jgi:hypothetical protein
MTDEKKNCIDPDHKNHICFMKAQGDSAELEKMIGNQSVECGICGAKAGSVEYICTPAKAFEDEQVA